MIPAHTYIAAAALVLTACATAGGSAPEPELRDTLIQLEKGSWDAWMARDGTYFASFLSDDHVEVGSYGIGTKDEIVKFVGNPVCVVKSFALDQFKFTRLSADTALLVYYAQQDTMCGKAKVPSPAWASSLYVRRDGRWQNALYQQTPTQK